MKLCILAIMMWLTGLNNVIDRGVYSLKIGMDIDEFKNVVEAEDVTEKHFHVDNEKIFKVTKFKSYKGKEIRRMYVFFYRNKLYRVDIKYCFECLSKPKWDEMMKGLFKRYNLPKVNNYYIYGWDDGLTEAIVFRREYLLIYRDDKVTDVVNAEEDKIFPFLKEFEKEIEKILEESEKKKKSI